MGKVGREVGMGRALEREGAMEGEEEKKKWFLCASFYGEEKATELDRKRAEREGEGPGERVKALNYSWSAERLNARARERMEALEKVGAGSGAKERVKAEAGEKEKALEKAGAVTGAEVMAKALE